MKTRTLLLTALAAPALLSFTSQETYRIRFAPTPGKAVTKTFSTTSEMSLDGMDVSMNDQPVPMGGESAMDMTSTQTLKVTDEYLAAGEGRIELLARTYDSIDVESTMDVAMMGNSSEVESRGTSRLEGAAVVFEHNADTGEHDVAFKEGEDGDADLLEGLAVDLDLTALLPGEALELEGTYDIDPRAVAEILAPGGDLKVEVETDASTGPMPGADTSSMTDFQRYFRDVVEGEASGKLVEVIEQDGARIALIELEFEVQADADLTEMMNDLGKSGELPPGVDMTIDKQTVAMIYEGGGMLRWNLTDGHLAGLELKADVAIESDTAMTMNGEMSMAMNMAMSGTMTSTVSVE